MTDLIVKSFIKGDPLLPENRRSCGTLGSIVGIVCNLVLFIIKLAAGLIPLLAIKSGLKAPLLALCGGNDIANGLRYFLITSFAGCVWPLTFKFFKSLSTKK